MSTEKDSPCSANDENTLKFGYNYPPGRFSPSSWDDSNEELSDGDSSTTADIPADDRRQSLARVKRRTRSIGSDSDNAKASSNEFVSYSAKPDGREAMCPNLSPAHQSWDDWDSEEIILGIENYLNEKRLSLIRSKIARNQSSINEYVSVLNGKGTNQTEIFRSVDFRSNLNGKLSKIVEVEESKSNTSLKSSETPRSAIPLCSQTSNKFIGYTADDGPPDFSCSDTRRETERNDTDNRNQRFVSMTYSSGDKFVSLTDDDDSDNSDDWPGIRSEMKRKNSEYAMTYKDSEYVSNSLKFIFDEKSPKEQPSEVDDLDFEHLNINEKFENEVRNNNRNDEDANESITPNEESELPGRTLNNASSKETVDFGLENLFHLGQEHSQTAADGYAAGQGDIGMTRSGREAFLARDSSEAWNIPTSRSGSKRVRGNHTISLSKPEKLTNYMKDTNQIMYFKEDWERNKPQNCYTEREMPIERDCFSRQGSSQEQDNSSSNSEKSNNSKICVINTNDEEDNGIDSQECSPTSFRSQILLDLKLSDNEEKCSTLERIVFGGSPESVHNCGTPRTTKWSPSEKITVKHNMTIIGKSGTRPTDEVSCNGNIQTYDCHQFGIGDSKWNADEIIGRKTNIPQDRGDITYERPDTKPGWSKLIMSLEETSPKKKPKETVFWVDVGTNKPDYQLQGSTDSRVFPIKQDEESIYTTSNVYSHFPKKKIKCRRIKAKKRKRESVLTGGGQVFGETESHNQWGNRLFDRRGNWLVNTVTRREDALTRSKRWFQALIVTRKRRKRPGYQYKWHSSTQRTRNRSKFTDCFSNLFKQIVNIFTVSRMSRK